MEGFLGAGDGWTLDEARRIASNIAKLPNLVGKRDESVGLRWRKEMPTDIADVAESLRLDFGETARWRREKAAEHPEDSRNVEAAELLDRLAKTIKDVDPTLLDAYGSLWDDDVQDSEQHSEMLRLIGFQSFPHTAEEFVKEYITKRTGG
jgi:hypothetical protein